MELETEPIYRRCSCGEYSFPVDAEAAARIDAGKARTSCGPNCWGVYLARNANKETGNL